MLQAMKLDFSLVATTLSFRVWLVSEMLVHPIYQNLSPLRSRAIPRSVLPKRAMYRRNVVV